MTRTIGSDFVVEGTLHAAEAITGDTTLALTRDGSLASITLTSYRDNVTIGTISLRGARGTEATPTIVLDQDAVARIQGWGYSAAAAAFVHLAEIMFRVDGTPDSSGDTTDMPGKIEFWVTAEGAGVVSKAAEITNDKQLTLFGALDGLQADFAQTGTTGNALKVSRNLASASTDSPLVDLIQDNTGDDQVALRLQQDGTGDIVNIFDGATEVFTILDGGNQGINQATPTATLHVTQTATTGDALRVIRDLAAASTNSPLVNLIQDNTGDDQVALRIQQDGTGNILTCLDANAEVLTVVDGGAVFVRPGTASDTAKVGGTLLVSTTQTGNAGAGEDQLLDYTLPANTLAANGQGIRVEAFGTIANNANSKKILFRFGSSGTNLVLDTGLSFASAAHVWELVATVIRTGSATQKAYCKITVSDNSTFTIAEKVGFSSALDQTLSSIVAVRINGQGVDNNDVVIEGARITWFGENT